MTSPFVEFIEKNIWVPIVVCIVVAATVTVLIWWLCYYRRRHKRGYITIQADDVSSHLTLSRYQRQTAERDVASMYCQYYLRSNPQLKLLDQLEDVGLREHVSWFLLAKTKDMNQIMAMYKKPARCPFPLTKRIFKVLNNLLALLRHPYLVQVTEAGFLADHNMIILLHEFSKKGSVRDIIYGANPLRHHEEKYPQRRVGKAFSTAKVAVYGRQILEAMKFLQEKNIRMGHIHSGNVFIHNNTARLAGYEQALIGLIPLQYPLLRRLVKGRTEALDVLCFGHLIFEMARGYRCDSDKPDIDEIYKCGKQLAEVLSHIFYHPEERVPTLMEVMSLSFFFNVPQMEMSALITYRPPPIVFSSAMKELLAAVKQNRKIKTASTRRQSTAETSFSAGTTPSTSQASSRAQSPAPSTGSFSAGAAPASSSSSAASRTASPPPPAVGAAPERSAPPSPAPSDGGGDSGRGQLLASIRQGKSLKKAETNDRSAPSV